VVAARDAAMNRMEDLDVKICQEVVHCCDFTYAPGKAMQ
jgi:hypothetical protein